MQTTIAINIPSRQQKEESSKPDSNPNKISYLEKILTAVIKVEGFQIQIPALRKSPIMLGRKQPTADQACTQKRNLENPTEV